MRERRDTAQQRGIGLVDSVSCRQACLSTVAALRNSGIVIVGQVYVGRHVQKP